MSFGKGSGTSIQTAQPTAEQLAQIKAQTEFFTGTVAPTYQQAVQGATELYNTGAPGVTQAAQNLAGTAAQAQQTFGTTGESALRTGISGLENLFGGDYEQRQLAAALAPAQAQYQQNLAGLGAQYGGAGQIGSARQAFAQQQLAGQTQAAQMQTAADVERNVAAQRLAAGQSLTQAGMGGLQQALSAAGTGVSAALAPQDLYSKYASVIFGTPSASYNPNFAGTGGMATSTQSSKFGISI